MDLLGWGLFQRWCLSRHSLQNVANCIWERMLNLLSGALDVTPTPSPAQIGANANNSDWQHQPPKPEMEILNSLRDWRYLIGDPIDLTKMNQSTVVAGKGHVGIYTATLFEKANLQSCVTQMNRSKHGWPLTQFYNSSWRWHWACIL